MLARVKTMPDLMDWMGESRAEQSDDECVFAMQKWAAVTSGLHERESAD